MKKTVIVFLFLIYNSALFSQNWEGFSPGKPNSAFTCSYSDTANEVIYVGGKWLSGDTINYTGVLSWQGQAWDTIGNELTWPINAIIKYQDTLYVGSSLGFSRWDGTQWESIGNFNSAVVKFLEYDNELLILGYFTEVNGQTVNGLVKWNDQQFTAFPDLITYTNGAEPYIFCGTVYHEELYVGGNFSNTTDTLMEIAKWDGSHWTAVGQGFVGSFADVREMKVYHDELYVVGAFSNEGLPNPGNFIARWNGNEWHDVGGGLSGNSAAWDLIKKGDYLYVCGSFTSAGGVWSPGIARWDGSEWCSMNDTMLGYMRSVTVLNDTLYLIGDVIIQDGDTLTDLFKWVGGDELQPCSSIVSVSEDISDEDFIQLYPNPASNTLIIETSSQTNASYSIYDITGRLLLTASLSRKTSIDVSDFDEGVYVIQLQTAEGMVSRRFIKQ